MTNAIQQEPKLSDLLRLILEERLVYWLHFQSLVVE